jgi:hypothetical protein
MLSVADARFKKLLNPSVSLVSAGFEQRLVVTTYSA